MGIKAVISLGLGLSVAACDLPFGYTYRAEVGYHNEGKETWFVGSNKRYDECIAEARSRFNSLNTAESPRRAFSWACRKMKGEKFEERVR